jgi:hypothetical protein
MRPTVCELNGPIPILKVSKRQRLFSATASTQDRTHQITTQSFSLRLRLGRTLCGDGHEVEHLLIAFLQSDLPSFLLEWF